MTVPVRLSFVKVKFAETLHIIFFSVLIKFNGHGSYHLFCLNLRKICLPHKILDTKNEESVRPWKTRKKEKEERKDDGGNSSGRRNVLCQSPCEISLSEHICFFVWNRPKKKKEKKSSRRDGLHRRESTISRGSRSPQTGTVGAHK